jgi:hypothetical protein
VTTDEAHPHGLVVRNLRRGLEDQKGLYLAPFKPKNLKWDALLLGTTAALLAADRQISRDVPTDHVNISHDIALICLGGTGAAIGGLWAYGIKTDNPRAKEIGELTLESLANTFLIYTPMQFIAGRERPDERNRQWPFLATRGIQHVFSRWTCDVRVVHGDRGCARISAPMGQDAGVRCRAFGFRRETHGAQPFRL